MPKTLEWHPAWAMNWREDHQQIMHCSTHQIIGCHRPGENQYEAVASPSIELHHHISDVKIPPDKKKWIFGRILSFPHIVKPDQNKEWKGWMEISIGWSRNCIRLDKLIIGVTTTGTTINRRSQEILASTESCRIRRSFSRDWPIAPGKKWIDKPNGSTLLNEASTSSRKRFLFPKNRWDIDQEWGRLPVHWEVRKRWNWALLSHVKGRAIKE